MICRSPRPRLSGQVVEVRTHDNQHVHKGDVLYVIEKFDFEGALDNANATILNRLIFSGSLIKATPR